MIRTSTFVDSLVPSGSTVPSCNTRRSLAWAGSGSVRLALRQLGARLLQLSLERPLGGDPLQLEDDLVEVERLGEVVVGAFLERRDRVVDRGVGGDEDDVRPRRLLAHAAE